MQCMSINEYWLHWFRFVCIFFFSFFSQLHFAHLRWSVTGRLKLEKAHCWSVWSTQETETDGSSFWLQFELQWRQPANVQSSKLRRHSLVDIYFLSYFSLNLYMYLFFPVKNSRKACYCVSDSNMEAHALSLTDVVLFYLLCACFNFPLSCVCAVLIYICFEQLAIALGT